MNFLEINAEWESAIKTLETFAESTTDQCKKNIALSGIENAITYRKCARMIDGLNHLIDTKHRLGLC